MKIPGNYLITYTEWNNKSDDDEISISLRQWAKQE